MQLTKIPARLLCFPMFFTRFVSVIIPFLAFCGLASAQTLTKVDDQISVSNEDWPWWRGPGRLGAASTGATIPPSWSDSERVVWESPIDGRGHGSPIVVGENIFLATADESTGAQSVLCFDRQTGNIRWKKVIHESGGMWKNSKSTAASSSLACDGQSLFVAFPNDGGLHATALNPSGEILWQKRICNYIEHQGYGASPALYQALVIISADNKGGGAVVGLDRKTGEEVWRRERPSIPNYSSPSILHVSGRDQLIMTGCNLVTSLNPLTGELLWEIEGATEECVTTTVTNGELVYSSGGYPRNHVAAIRADGSGTIAWEINNRVYVPSMVIDNGYLYGVMDAGIAYCWEASTGKELWKGRLGGTFSASPVLVDGKVLVTNEGGESYIFKASPDGLEVIAKNKLGDEAFATPIVCGNRIYFRIARFTDNKRQEYLVCVE